MARSKSRRKSKSGLKKVVSSPLQDRKNGKNALCDEDYNRDKHLLQQCRKRKKNLVSSQISRKLRQIQKSKEAKQETCF